MNNAKSPGTTGKAEEIQSMDNKTEQFKSNGILDSAGDQNERMFKCPEWIERRVILGIVREGIWTVVNGEECHEDEDAGSCGQVRP